MVVCRSVGLMHREWALVVAAVLVLGACAGEADDVPIPGEAVDSHSPANCHGGAVPQFAGVPHGWTALPAPPQPRARAASIWTGQHLLLIGGDTGFGATRHASVFRFDPQAGSWTCSMPAPFPVGWRDVVWTGQLVYAWGRGQAATYEPTSDTWRELPTPPDAEPAVPLVVAWTGEEFVVWGSRSRTSPSRRGFAYDPGEQRWRELADAPFSVNRGYGVWTGDELVVYGAQLDTGNQAATQSASGAAYDPQANSWRQLPPFPLSPQATSIAWTGNMLVAWDYELQAGAYHPASRAWTPLPSLPLRFAECYPRTTVLGDGRVFAWYCGQAAVRRCGGPPCRRRSPRTLDARRARTRSSRSLDCRSQRTPTSTSQALRTRGTPTACGDGTADDETNRSR